MHKMIWGYFDQILKEVKRIKLLSFPMRKYIYVDSLATSDHLIVVEGVESYIKVSMLGHTLCVESSKVLEIIPYEKSLFKCTTFSNVTTYKGKVTPLVDYRHSHGISSICKPHKIVFSVSGRAVIIVVDGLLGILEVNKSEVKPPPPNLTKEFNFVNGSICDNEQDFPIIDVQKLFGPVI